MSRVMTRLMYGRSKYGGNRPNMTIAESPDWTCQACGLSQTKSIPFYMFEIFKDEFIKICPSCKHTALKKRVVKYIRLAGITRIRIKDLQGTWQM